MQLRIAYQGEPGAYSEQALSALRSDALPVPCPTFADLYSAIDRGAADELLAPVENTIVGPVNDSLDALARSPLHIRQETTLRIRHQLIGIPGSRLSDIRSVRSHPVALAQCRRFLSAHPQITALAAADTAGSLRELMQSPESHTAAIASSRAASVYGGQVLAPDIEDSDTNYTRFLLLGPDPNPATVECDKATLLIAADPSLLPRVCALASDHHLSIINVISRPVPDQPWHYYQWIDVSGPSHALAALEFAASRLSPAIRWFGAYPGALCPAPPLSAHNGSARRDVSIASLRKQIDVCDRKLVDLLNQRARGAQHIGHLKLDQGLPIYEPQREKTIFENISRSNAGPLPSSELHRIFERIIDVMRSIQRTDLNQTHNHSDPAKQVKP